MKKSIEYKLQAEYYVRSISKNEVSNSNANSLKASFTIFSYYMQMD